MRLKVKPKPRLYDEKTVNKFAYLPTRIDDTIIWLEYYKCTYVYIRDWLLGIRYWVWCNKELIK